MRALKLKDLRHLDPWRAPEEARCAQCQAMVSLSLSLFGREQLSHLLHDTPREPRNGDASFVIPRFKGRRCVVSFPTSLFGTSRQDK